MRTGARWRDRIGLPSTLLGSALLLTAVVPAALSAGPAITDAEGECPAGPMAVVRAALHPPSERATTRVQQLLGRRGELTGRVLTVERSGRAPVGLSLPPESFVGRRVGDLIVYTLDTSESGSSIHLLDVESGCDVIVAHTSDVVRSALLDPTASAIYAHSVTREGRQDNGIMRVDLSSAETNLAVPPLPDSDAFGPTFGTELRWSLDGTALAVQSCGFERCRTRILDVASGALATFDAPGQGALVGLTSAHLVTLADCAGLPCDVVSIDLASRAMATLAEDALGASLNAWVGGSAIVSIETAAGVVEVVQ